MLKEREDKREKLSRPFCKRELGHYTKSRGESLLVLGGGLRVQKMPRFRSRPN